MRSGTINKWRDANFTHASASGKKLRHKLGIFWALFPNHWVWIFDFDTTPNITNLGQINSSSYFGMPTGRAQVIGDEQGWTGNLHSYVSTIRGHRTPQSWAGSWTGYWIYALYFYKGHVLMAWFHKLFFFLESVDIFCGGATSPLVVMTWTFARPSVESCSWTASKPARNTENPYSQNSESQTQKLILFLFLLPPDPCSIILSYSSSTPIPDSVYKTPIHVH